VIVADGHVAGSIGYWEHTEAGVTVWESGWAVLPADQGRGIAGRAIREIIRLASAERSHRSLHAYPAVENAPSNTACRKAGFTLIGPRRFEYPKGHWMICNDWSLDLDQA
jgi:RimJ/RimL family protein N-acetyltransferase